MKSCGVCGGTDCETICSAHEIAVEHEYLIRFHKKRLRRGAPRAALADKAEFTQNDPAEIVACTRCGLLRRNTLRGSMEVVDAYREDHYGTERLDALFASQLESSRSLARNLSRYLPSGARVLEIGSFVGGFLTAGQELGWEMVGVDPGDEVGDYSRSRGLNVVHGTVADLSAEPGSLDCIAIWNTFDQIPEPRETLAAAAPLICPDGLLAVRVPNGAFYRRATRVLHPLRHSHLKPLSQPLLCSMAWNNMLSFPYLFGYSVNTLDRLFKEYGLRRMEVHGDTLCRLADSETRAWAALEEGLVKGVVRAAGGIESLGRGSSGGFTLSPWLNVTYQKERGYSESRI